MLPDSAAIAQVGQTLTLTLKLTLKLTLTQTHDLSGPNRAMQPPGAMRFASHIPKSLAIRKSSFASDAKTHSLDLKSLENARKKSLRKSCDVGLRREKSGCSFKTERCEMPAIWTPVAVWPAMRAPAMPNR